MGKYEPEIVNMGSAVKPGLGFYDDETTGLFLKSKSTIGIATGGSEIASIASKALSLGANAKIYCGSETVADDGCITFPAHTVFMFGWILAKAGASYTLFNVTADGTVTLLTDTSSDVTKNADTDGKLCIGTAATQNPLQIKNGLGNAYDVNYFIVYY